MTVGELQMEINNIMKSPILFVQLVFRGQLLRDKNQTMRELGVTDFTQLTLTSFRAEEEEEEDPDIQ